MITEGFGQASVRVVNMEEFAKVTKSVREQQWSPLKKSIGFLIKPFAKEIERRVTNKLWSSDEFRKEVSNAVDDGTFGIYKDDDGQKYINVNTLGLVFNGVAEAFPMTSKEYIDAVLEEHAETMTVISRCHDYSNEVAGFTPVYMSGDELG